MISVVIPSHESVDEIFQQTLSSLVDQDYPEDKYEVIVVQNPPSVSMKDYIDNKCPKNFTTIESKLGSNNARNAGIKEAKFPTLALTDDDTLLYPHWLSTISKIFEEDCDDQISCVGGPLDLLFVQEQPEWLVGELLSSLSYVNHEARGDSPRDLNFSLGEWLVTANLAFHKSVWEKVGGFNGDIGLHGLQKDTSNDELLFLKECTSHGRVLYAPNMTMLHQIPSSRATFKYLEEREYGQGRADAETYFTEHPQSSVEDAYHDVAQGIFNMAYPYEPTFQVRETLSNEETTRKYIRALLRARLAKMVGLVNKIEGREVWTQNKDA